MAERIDHAAEARKHLDDVKAYGDDAHSFRFNDEEGRAIQALSHGGLSAQQAQVHATLALVEQVRIANLIALGTVGGGPINNAAPGHVTDYLRRDYPEIAKGLGL